MFTMRINNLIELKLLNTDDAEELFTAVDDNREHLRQWLPWVDATLTVDDSRTFIQSTLEQYRNNQGFTVGIYYNGRLAGMIGYHFIDWENMSTGIGYWLSKRFQGKGIAVQSVQKLIDYAFTEWSLNRIEIRAAVGNVKSRAIPEKIGFINEGILRQVAWINDRFVDMVNYSLLRDEWIQIRRRATLFDNNE